MLYMVDQHAADERVQLERLLRCTVQPLTGLPVPGGIERAPLQPIFCSPSTPACRARRVRVHPPSSKAWLLRELGSLSLGSPSSLR